MNEIDYRTHFKNPQAYDKLTQSKHVSLIYQLEKEVLFNILKRINSQEKTLMDFACGTGRWTRILENSFQETTGVDVSEGMIDLARQKSKKAKFVVTDITSQNVDRQLKDRKFDVVTAFRFYKNAEQDLRYAVTKNLPKYLKDDGLFIFDLHLNTFSFMGILAGIIRFLKLHKIFGIASLTIRTISLKDIRKLFKDSPFRIIDYYGMGLLPGRSNYTILPQKFLHKWESFFTKRKILRPISYNLLIVAQKKS